jgi:hypothetical protein
VADAVHIDRYDAHGLTDRDDREAGLFGHPFGGPVAGARLGGGDRRVRDELRRRAQDSGALTIDDDGAVHLGQLPQTGSVELDIQHESAAADRLNGLVVAEHDKSARAASQDPLEPFPQFRARCHRGECLTQLRLCTTFVTAGHMTPVMTRR